MGNTLSIFLSARDHCADNHDSRSKPGNKVPSRSFNIPASFLHPLHNKRASQSTHNQPLPESPSIAAAQPPARSPLPCDLLHRIFALILPPDLSRLRSVCKSWHSAISSPEFLLLYKQLHPPLDSRLYLKDKSCDRVLSWSSLQSRWLKFDSGAICFDVSLLLGPDSWAATGGLLCLNSCSWRAGIMEMRYLVGNPFTDTWMQLPCPSTAEDGKIWSIWTLAGGKQYWVTVLYYASGFMQVYDSKKGSWSFKELPQLAVGKRWWLDRCFCNSGGASGIGDKMYCIHYTSRSIFAFDVKQDIWKKMNIQVPEVLTHVALHKGRSVAMYPQIVGGPMEEVFLVGGLEGRPCLESMAVVWELNSTSMVWREVTRAPRWMWMSMLEAATEKLVVNVRYAGDGGLIFVMASFCSRVMTYSLISGSWDWLELPSNSKVCDPVAWLSTNPQ